MAATSCRFSAVVGQLVIDRDGGRVFIQHHAHEFEPIKAPPTVGVARLVPPSGGMPAPWRGEAMFRVAEVAERRRGGQGSDEIEQFCIPNGSRLRSGDKAVVRRTEPLRCAPRAGGGCDWCAGGATCPAGGRAARESRRTGSAWAARAGPAAGVVNPAGGVVAESCHLTAHLRCH